MIRLSRAGEYAMILMIELARCDKDYYPLKSIIKGHVLSASYMDSVARTLVRCGLVEALHGFGGGYRLSKKPERYTVLEIILAVDSVSPKDRLDDDTLTSFFDVWDDAKESFLETLSGMTLDKVAGSGLIAV